MTASDDEGAAPAVDVVVAIGPRLVDADDEVVDGAARRSGSESQPAMRTTAASTSIRRQLPTVMASGYVGASSSQDTESFGEAMEPDVSIESLDVDPDRKTLYFGVGLTGPLYRLELPDGSPQRIGDGNGITISPDGSRLAFARRRDLVVRSLPRGQEEVLEGFIGDLGGRPVSWAADSRTLAVEIDGADVTHVVVLDTASGDTTELKPRSGDPRNYTPEGPWFRRSDGLLAVVCCSSGEINPEAPPATPELVLHDPATGEERDRGPLRLRAWGYDYDSSGTHQLLTSADDIYRQSDGEMIAIPDIPGARLAVW